MIILKDSIWLKYNDEEISKIMEMGEDYKDFLSCSKTEREASEEVIKRALKEGFKDIKEYSSLKPGDKVYVSNRGKAIALFVIGKEKIRNGINILGAHIDSPRLDLKASPLYEDSSLAYLDTHYYGGIKKYQWTTIPLALHGVVVKKDGSKININIGEKEDDPVFCVTDLLPHLASEQMKKQGSSLIEGEALDILVGGMPLKGKEKEMVKAKVLDILKEKYDIVEDDFLSSEIEVVPTGSARDLGFDRSMIISYGQDDRSCAYSSLKAFFDSKESDKTISCLLVDKEEIGSVGATGMESMFYENVIARICSLMGEDSYLAVRDTLANSKVLSSDVNAGFDPLYASVMDKRSSSYLANGLVFCKYTGARGKSGSNDADAEFIADIRNALDKDLVSYQFSELGKVDAGGGGTIAYMVAKYGAMVIDAGIAVLSMHAPYEVVSKVDVYEAYRGYLSFLNNI